MFAEPFCIAAPSIAPRCPVPGSRSLVSVLVVGRAGFRSRLADRYQVGSLRANHQADGLQRWRIRPSAKGAPACDLRFGRQCEIRTRVRPQRRQRRCLQYLLEPSRGSLVASSPRGYWTGIWRRAQRPATLDRGEPLPEATRSRAIPNGGECREAADQPPSLRGQSVVVAARAGLWEFRGCIDDPANMRLSDPWAITSRAVSPAHREPRPLSSRPTGDRALRIAERTRRVGSTSARARSWRPCC